MLICKLKWFQCEGAWKIVKKNNNIGKGKISLLGFFWVNFVCVCVCVQGNIINARRNCVRKLKEERIQIVLIKCTRAFKLAQLCKLYCLCTYICLIYIYIEVENSFSTSTSHQSKIAHNVTWYTHTFIAHRCTEQYCLDVSEKLISYTLYVVYIILLLKRFL